MNKKIFVQIASYRDPELLPTIRDCINKSKYPENLIFSIAWQHSTSDTWDNLDEFKDDSRFKIIDIDYEDSKGACWARNKLQKNYTDEEYTLQLDSHHRFVKNWDEILIDMYNSLKKGGVLKPLITTYLPPYNPSEDIDMITSVPWKMNFDRFIPEGAIFFLPAVIDNHKNLNVPLPARFYSAHFAFTSGNFVKEVPHDPNYYFHGEEISIAVRSFTWGYDLFHPHRVIAWHEYTRKNRTKQWDDDKEWHIKNMSSHTRNKKLFEMDGLKKDIDFGVYDFGNERTLSDYEKYSGISFKNRSVQKYTLENNPPPNPSTDDVNFEDTLISIFKYCINISKSELPNKKYKFIAVIFEDINNNTLNRVDLIENEINELYLNSEDSLKIWGTFETCERPYKWIVWPYVDNDGWGNKIENII